MRATLLLLVAVQAEVGSVRGTPRPGSEGRGDEFGSILDALSDPFAAMAPDAAQVLAAEAQDSGFELGPSVPLSNIVAPPDAIEQNRGGDDPPRFVVTVPSPDDDHGQVILEVDDSGVVRWHFPDPADSPDRLDRHIPSQTFSILILQVDVPAPPTADSTQATRGFGWQKFLHILTFPLDRAAVAAGEYAVTKWEEANRPYALSQVVTAQFGGPGVVLHPVGPSWSEWDKPEPFLLLVHGTFSSTQGAFHELFADSAWWAARVAQYGKRILAFDHPTMHDGVEANVAWLLTALPTGKPMTFDIVCHSRGGLVSRRLAVVPDVNVRKLIHVAVPNAGTLLASPQHWSMLFSVFTTALSLFPAEPFATGLKAVIEAVKQVGTGLLKGLHGLADMDPKGDFITAMLQLSAAESVHAIECDFTPAEVGPMTALNLVVDAFVEAANDLVVPTTGVSDAGHYRVPPESTSALAGPDWHSLYFKDEAVRTTLACWLTA